MFKIYLSRTVSLGVGISPPAMIEEVREAYPLLNGTDTVPLETATTYAESSVPNLHQYLYEVPVSEKRLEELNCLVYRVKWMDSQDEVVFGTEVEIVTTKSGKLCLSMIRVSIIERRIYSWIGAKSKTSYIKFNIMRKVAEVENKVVKGLKSKSISRECKFSLCRVEIIVTILL